MGFIYIYRNLKIETLKLIGTLTVVRVLGAESESESEREPEIESCLVDESDLKFQLSQSPRYLNN
jgi:hypothetical protein